MGNSLRCCLACVIPCGSLDLIRVVHVNGHVDEYSRPLPASEVLAAHPRHVLTAPSSRRILLVSRNSDLRRGQIYFLIPESSIPSSKKQQQQKRANSTRQRKLQPTKTGDKSEYCHADGYVEYDQERRSRRTPVGVRKTGRVGAWRPHLQSITEDL